MTPPAGDAGGADLLHRLVALLEHFNSCALHERHLAALRQLGARSEAGFAVRDLPKLQRVLEAVYALAAHDEAFVTPACAVIRCLGMPLVRQCTAEELLVDASLSSLLATLGQLFDGGHHEQLQTAAAEVLSRLSSAYGARPSILDLPLVQQATDLQSPEHTYQRHQRLIHSSGIAVKVAAALQRVVQARQPPADAQLVPALGQALLDASYHPATSSQLVGAGVLELIAALVQASACGAVLAAPGQCSPLMSPALLALLWNVLEYSPAEAMQQLEQGHCSGVTEGDAAAASAGLAARLVAALGGVLRCMLEASRGRQEAELRNDVAAVMRLLANSRACCAALPATGLLPAALQAALPPLTRQACSPTTGALASLRLTGSKSTDGGNRTASTLCDPRDDLELKQLLLGLLCTASASSSACLEQCLSAGLLQLLLSYCQPDAVQRAATMTASTAGRWGADQVVRLAALAWGQLQHVAPLCRQRLVDAGGVAVTLEAISSHGSSSNVEAALQLMRRVCGGDAGVADAFGAQGAVPAVLQQLCDPCSGEQLRQAALLALAALCEGCSGNQRHLRRAQGVEVLLAESHKLPALDPTLPSTYALAVLATLWACVLPDVRSRAAWLAGGGMDCLLRCLAAGNKHHRPAIIGLLADALADTRSHAFVHAWRGGGGSAGAGVPAARLLLDVWREQAGRRGICGPDGLLAAPARPLAGGGDQAACGTLEAAGGADAASRALLGGLQPVRRQQVAAIMQGCSSDQLLDKVYACLALLGFDQLGYLGPEDQALLLLVQHYASFRQGEVWQDIAARLDANGVKPTEDDSARLSSGVRRAEQLAHRVRERQAGVLGARSAALIAAERAEYSAMLGQVAADAAAKQRRREVDGSLLSTPERVEAKARQHDMLARSMQQCLQQVALK